MHHATSTWVCLDKCTTLGASHLVQHAECIMLGASHLVHHTGYILQGASTWVHQVGCVILSSSRIASLQNSMVAGALNQAHYKLHASCIERVGGPWVTVGASRSAHLHRVRWFCCACVACSGHGGYTRLNIRVLQPEHVMRQDTPCITWLSDQDTSCITSLSDQNTWCVTWL